MHNPGDQQKPEQTPATATQTPNAARHKQQSTAELLELGEMLFDTAIEAAQLPENAETNAPLIEELREAANEYFTLLRLLLSNK